MAYNERLARRVRQELKKTTRGLSEKKMFGGLAFLLRGNMCCGIVGDDLCVRVGPQAYESALAEPHARPMDFTGKPLRGMVFVGPEGSRRARLRAWVERSVRFADTLPPK